MQAKSCLAKTGDAVTALMKTSTAVAKIQGALSNEPMTDAEFEQFMCIENDEISVETVNFAEPTKTVFLFNPKTFTDAATTIQRTD